MSTIIYKLTEMIKPLIEQIKPTFGSMMKSFRIKKNISKSYASDAVAIYKPFHKI